MGRALTREQAHDYGRLCAAIAALRAIREPLQDVANATAMLEWVRDRYEATYAADAREKEAGLHG